MGRLMRPIFLRDRRRPYAKGPVQPHPGHRASASSLRAACETLAQRLRDAGRQRDEAVTVLRRIVYRHQVLLRSLLRVAEHTDDTARRTPGAPD